MIFAVIDYTCYRKRTGRFSNRRLEADNLKLATSKNFPNFSNIPVGSIIFCHTTNSILSWLIMYVDYANLSHVCVVTEPGIVTDVTTSGVIRHSVMNYLDDESYLSIFSIPNLSDEKKDGIKKFSDKTIGSPYGWHKVIRIGLYTLIGKLRFNWLLTIDVILLMTSIILATLGFNQKSLKWTLMTITSYILVIFMNQMHLRYKKKIRAESFSKNG